MRRHVVAGHLLVDEAPEAVLVGGGVAVVHFPHQVPRRALLPRGQTLQLLHCNNRISAIQYSLANPDSTASDPVRISESPDKTENSKNCLKYKDKVRKRIQNAVLVVQLNSIS